MNPAELGTSQAIGNPQVKQGTGNTESFVPEGWAELASEWGELSGVAVVDVPRVLRYILGLLRGVALHYDEINAEGASLQPMTVWRDPDNGFREVLQGEFQSSVLRCVRENQVVSESANYPEGAFRLTVPVIAGRSAASLLMIVPTPSAVHAALTVFQAGVGFLLFALHKRDYARQDQAWRETAAWVEICKRAMDAPFFDEAASVLVGDFQRHLGCDKVALGLCRGKRNRIEAVSAAAALDAKSPTVGLMEAVMAESRAANRPLRWPALDDKGSFLSKTAHQELALQSGVADVCSCPLPTEDGQCGGVLITLWHSERRMTESDTCFLDTVSPHLASLATGLRRSDPFGLRKNNYLLWTRLTERKKLVTKVALILVGLITLFPVQQSVRVDTQLEPVERRVISARFDGLLRESMVRPGDSVEAGDLLARLDDQELNWREAELTARRDRAVRQRDLTMTDHTAPVANIQMAQLEIESIDQELALTHYRRDNLEIRAPIDGVVLAGDLDRSTGIPVSQGQPLFEIGPLQRMVVELKIPSRDIALVREQARIKLRLAGFPGKTWKTVVSRIRPRAEQIGGRPMFVAEASMPEVDVSMDLRAGMNGKANIYSHYRPLLWVLTRRLFEFIHVTLFW